MAEVKILLQGYTSDESEGHSCSTISLIQDKDLNIVVDPGTSSSQEVIKDALNKEGLTIDNIDYVFITHSHMDHYRNIGMFPKSKALDYWGIWDSDTCNDYKEHFSKDIKIIKTPGHSYDSLTFLVKTDLGLIAICGDVFWKKNFPEKDPYAQDLAELEKSRKKLLEIADYIIPGHGEMFKVE